jgi:hypothetical protein
MKVERSQLHPQIVPARPDSTGAGDRVGETTDSTKDERKQRPPQKRGSLQDLVIQERVEEEPEGPNSPPPSREKGSGLNITV